MKFDYGYIIVLWVVVAVTFVDLSDTAHQNLVILSVLILLGKGIGWMLEQI